MAGKQQQKPKQKKARRLDWLQPAVLVGSIVPIVFILFKATTGRLGANPIATALNQLGLLAIILLLSSLACTPIKIVTGAKWPLRIRKTLGLMAFFTVLAHFLVYLVIDQVLAFGTVIEDVLTRPFIAVGFVAFLLLIPLALTSTKNAHKRLGPHRWRRLHRLAYVCGVLGVIHFVARVKQDLTEPLIYGAILAVLLGIRLVSALSRRRRAGLGSS